jgi:hypothetical protein
MGTFLFTKNKSMTKTITPIQSDLPTIIPHVDRVADFLQFAQWFATPKLSRKQKTQKDFAIAIGANQDTLTDWKRHPYFWPTVQQFIKEWMKERIPDVIDGLYRNACDKGQAKDVEFFLKLGGMINDSKNNKKINK